MGDMYEIVDAGFGYAEREPEPAVIWRHPTPDGREATVTQSFLCLRIDGRGGEDIYCYPTSMAAVLCAARWIEAGCRAEPDGWTSRPGIVQDHPRGVAPERWARAG